MIRDRRNEPERRDSKGRRSDPEMPEPTIADSDDERREDQRRRVVDRRFSASPFGAEKAELIRTKIKRTGALGACPLCNNPLTLGEPVVTEEGPQREVRCQTCWRSVAVTLV
jgi:hypothetical protein